MKIWALTSVDNDYNQPPNNLVAWWSTKPTLEQVCQAVLSQNFPPSTDEQVIQVVKIWNGEPVRVGSEMSGTDYTLKELKEGVL